MGINDINKRHDKELNDQYKKLTDRIQELHKTVVEQTTPSNQEVQKPDGELLQTGQSENTPKE